MKKAFLLILMVFLLSVPVTAAEFTPPPVPSQARDLMPRETTAVDEGLRELLTSAIGVFLPDLKAAMKISFSLLAAIILLSLIKTVPGPTGEVTELAGSAAMAGTLLMTSNSMIRLGTDTVTELHEYGKLLLPVMTGALAAQGGVTKSAALYAGTLGFMALLGSLISRVLIPMTYLYLAFSLGSSALGEDLLKRLRNLTKSIITWSLRSIITVFITYIGLSGVVSGTADAAALKAAKATVSTVVPVVGGILSGASEAMVLSIGTLKNAAGVYGIFAVLAIFLGPFLKILAHYWVLKGTQAVSSLLYTGRTEELLGDFSTAMGFLLAMTGTACLLLLMGITCFMKGVI